MVTLIRIIGILIKVTLKNNLKATGVEPVNANVQSVLEGKKFLEVCQRLLKKISD